MNDKEEERKSRYVNQSIEKAFSVIDLFYSDRPKLSITEISEELNLTPGSIYPILYTLKEKGYLKKDGNKKYALGLKFLEKSNVILESLDLRSTANTYLRKLADSLRGNAHLALLHDREVLYLEREEGSPGVTIKEIVGHRVPAYCTALGKILLTQLDSSELDDYFQEVELKERGPNTTTDPREIREELSEIKRKGFSVDNEEFHDNLLAVAAPVRNYQNEIVAAISLSFPKSKYPRLEIERPVEEIKKTAAEISRKLGSSI